MFRVEFQTYNMYTSGHLHALKLQIFLFETVILFKAKKLLSIVRRKAKKLANKAVQLAFLTMLLYYFSECLFLTSTKVLLYLSARFPVGGGEGDATPS